MNSFCHAVTEKLDPKLAVAGSAKNLCGKGLTCWISLRNISPTFKTLKLQIWGIQRPSKCKKITFKGKFHGNVTSHFSALIVTDFIP